MQVICWSLVTRKTSSDILYSSVIYSHLQQKNRRHIQGRRFFEMLLTVQERNNCFKMLWKPRWIFATEGLWEASKWGHVFFPEFFPLHLPTAPQPDRWIFHKVWVLILSAFPCFWGINLFTDKKLFFLYIVFYLQMAGGEPCGPSGGKCEGLQYLHVNGHRDAWSHCFAWFSLKKNTGGSYSEPN